MNTFAKLLLLAALALAALPANAQAVSNVSGTIDAFMIDDGYIVIDGKRMILREADLVITYRGEAVRPSLVSAGLTVLYSTRDDGTVTHITLVGPLTRLEQIDQQ